MWFTAVCCCPPTENDALYSQFFMHARLASKGRSYGIFAEVCTQEFKLQESGTRDYITLYSI